MNLNCTEIRNLLEEKPKKGRVNNLDDYDYVRLLYENAKGNARRKVLEKTSTVHLGEKKFADIHMFLRDMEINGAFNNDASYSSYGHSEGNKNYNVRMFLRAADNDEVLDSNGSEYSSFYSNPHKSSPGLNFDEFVAARRQRRVHSSTNSDYSFWSLNSSVTSTRESPTDSSPNYADLIRLQSRYYVY